MGDSTIVMLASNLEAVGVAESMFLASGSLNLLEFSNWSLMYGTRSSPSTVD